MKYVVIMERRLSDWFMHVPALDRGVLVRSPADALDRAARLISAVTGGAIDPEQIAVQQSAPGALLLPVVPAEVEILHDDGDWYSGRHVGWLKQRDHSWRALVCYQVADVQWERTLPVSRLRTVDVRAVDEPAALFGTPRRDPGSGPWGTERGRPAERRPTPPSR